MEYFLSLFQVVRPADRSRRESLRHTTATQVFAGEGLHKMGSGRTIPTFALVFAALAVAGPSGSAGPGAGDRPGRAPHPPRDETRVARDAAGVLRAAPLAPMPLGPAPRLDPITRFLPPIDPWVKAGLGFGEDAIGEDGEPICTTNQRPATGCDPSGPRPFVHSGFDALPAADRSVRASAAGRVVSARHAFAKLVGGVEEKGGVVLIEHDLDGDPDTPDDRIVTIYEHVEPLVDVGAIVQQGDVIARTSDIDGEFLHFGARRAPFDPASPDIYRGLLPPAGTTGCLPCAARPLPVPAFPEQWEDPDRLFRDTSNWVEILDGGDEGGEDIVETADGFLVGGWKLYPLPSGVNQDMWLVKLDRAGRIVSQRSFGSPEAGDFLLRFVPVADGGYVALGYDSGQGMVLIRLDAAGNMNGWRKAYTGDVPFVGSDLRATPDGGFVVAGFTSAPGSTVGTIVLKLDGAGDVQWARTVSIQGQTIRGVSIAPAPDGGYGVALTVRIAGVTDGIDAGVLRLDADGHKVSAFMYRDPARSGDDIPAQIEAKADGGFTIVGQAPWTRSNIGFSPGGVWLLEVRDDGNIEREFLYSSFSVESAFRMVPTAAGGRLLVGRALDNAATERRLRVSLLEIDGDGAIVRQKALDGRTGTETPGAVHATRDGGFVVLGGEDITRPPYNVLVAKMNADLDCPEGCSVETALVRPVRFSSRQLLPLLEQTAVVDARPAEWTTSETEARVYPCEGGAYGPAPAIVSFSVENAQSPASCDYTSLITDAACYFGVPGLQPIAPV